MKIFLIASYFDIILNTILIYNSNYVSWPAFPTLGLFSTESYESHPPNSSTGIGIEDTKQAIKSAVISDRYAKTIKLKNSS